MEVLKPSLILPLLPSLLLSWKLSGEPFAAGEPLTLELLTWEKPLPWEKPLTLKKSFEKGWEDSMQNELSWKVFVSFGV